MSKPKPNLPVAQLLIVAALAMMISACGEEPSDTVLPFEDNLDEVTTDEDPFFAEQDFTFENMLDIHEFLKMENFPDFMTEGHEVPLDWYYDTKNEFEAFASPVVRPRGVNYYAREVTVQDVEGETVFTGEESSYWTAAVKLDQRSFYRLEFVKVGVGGIEERVLLEGSYEYDGSSLRFLKEEVEVGEDKVLFSMDFHYYRAGDLLWLEFSGDQEILPGEQEFVSAYFGGAR